MAEGIPEIRFVIFDLDDVLYDFDHPLRLALLEELTGRPAADIDRDVWGGPEEDLAETGVPATAEGYLQQFGDLLKYPIDYETWVDIRTRMLRPRPQVLDMVRQLKAQADIALLTNNGMLLKKALPVCSPEAVELFGEKSHVSADYGARKPDPVVYQRICDHYGYAPSQCFFVDDKPENIEGAEQAGLKAHLFVDADGLLRSLKALGFKMADIQSESAVA